ncbi:MAG: ATP-binding cassette domain-containing protein, partial [Pararhodobacter sp.]
MLDVQSLEKAYGSKLAGRGISFSVEKGTVLGFLGPNGAGKSTT